MSSRGNNLHEVQTAKGEHYLVSMPTKFRKNVWIKRGILTSEKVSVHHPTLFFVPGNSKPQNCKCKYLPKFTFTCFRSFHNPQETRLSTEILDSSCLLKLQRKSGSINFFAIKPYKMTSSERESTPCFLLGRKSY